MGHKPDWVGQDMKKVRHMSDGGEAGSVDTYQSPVSVNFDSGTFEDGPTKGRFATGRVGFNKIIDEDRSVEFGVSGMHSQVKAGDFKKTDTKLSGADVTYRNKDTDYGVAYDEKPGMGGQVNRTITLRFNKRF